jgi:chemotaxis protein MotB
MGGKKNEVEEKEDTNSWMTTYSDLVTLLFAFFVLMFAISNVDQKKFSLMAAAFSKEGLTIDLFNEITHQYGDSILPFNDNPYTEPPGEIVTPDKSDTAAPGTEGDGNFSYLGETSLETLYDTFSDYIETNELTHSITAEFQGENLLLTITDNDVWFTSGSADLTPRVREVSMRLGELLHENQNADDPFDIVVVGHTDNVPIHTLRFDSNWELSVARAVNFLRVLIDTSGLNPNNFSARGCGETMPVADNSTAEGRQQNRRVEVLVSVSSAKEIPTLRAYTETPGAVVETDVNGDEGSAEGAE